jgi:hypothetical protein
VRPSFCLLVPQLVSAGWYCSNGQFRTHQLRCSIDGLALVVRLGQPGEDKGPATAHHSAPCLQFYGHAPRPSGPSSQGPPLTSPLGKTREYLPDRRVGHVSPRLANERRPLHAQRSCLL